MKFQPIPSRFLVIFLTSIFIAHFCSTSRAWAEADKAEPDNGDLATMGLVIQWESNIGGAPPANGSQSLVVWPHTTAKREYVTVRNGSRVIERIRGEEVDQKALEAAIFRGEKLLKTPRLGLEGAKMKAEKLVATYKILGRKVETEPYSQRLVYAVSLTTNGIIQVIDAETGAVIWRTDAGNSTLPMFGPGVSDEYVAVTNGNMFYVYELMTGNIVTSRQLAYTPTACPSVLLDKVIVPSIDGRLVSYDIKKEVAPQGIIRIGTENRLGTTISANHRFLSWPTGKRLVQARMEKTPTLWTYASLNEPIVCLPIATQNGFLASTIYGTVFHCSETRDDTVLWKSRLAVQITQSPIANKDLAFFVSDEGLLFALRLADGVDAWGHQPKNVRNMIAVGKAHIYVKDSRNSLVAIELATGLVSGRSDLILPDVLPNTINDRLFYITKQGQVTCLREADATLPTFSTEFSGVVAPAPIKQTKPEDGQSPLTTEDANVFEGAGAMNDAAAAADPFGTDPP